ncbi:MAG: hypothetical protein WCO52_04185 [bacterium]
MIYLIGGPPRCGKTTLARELSRRLAIPYVPADYLMSVITPYIPREDMKERLPHWYARVKTEKSNDRLYAEYTPQEIVDGYLVEAESYWPGIKNFIVYALHDEQDFIIEGAQLRPDLVRALLAAEGEERFKALFLCKSGEDIVSGLKASQVPGDWAQRDTSDETYPKIAQMIETYSAMIREGCLRCGLPTLDTSDDFPRLIEEAVAVLVS